MQAASHTINTTKDLAKGFPVTKPAWIGKQIPDGKSEHSLEYLIQEEGMTLIDWDGRTTHTITDRSHRNIGLLGGVPRTRNWDEVQQDAAAAIRRAGTLLYVPENKLRNRRGQFISVAMGLSFGGGRKVPGMLKQDGRNFGILDEVLQNSGLQSIVGHTDSLFKLYAPRLHAHYNTTLDSVIHWSRNRCHRVFPNSVFAAATINTGERVVSVSHSDHKNLSWGLCSITALGNFDPDFGGHLVLWDLKYVIRFPPGSTILIPSALLRHSNVPIRTGEVRHSFTQYTAGGLFRFVHNKFKANNKLSEEELLATDEEGKNRWKEGLKMFSTLEELS
ncbi:hypothetical protein BJ165DRAFT_1353445 [Panaeolus papilionaceus]|nr:hypothetical protein BJ165DRAFT_1353445 [Panaeolus papilionaceus]